MKISEKINKRRLKYGSLATALTALFIAAIVLVNIVATMLFNRFPITLDLTSGSIYTVSAETAEYIAGIDVPVSITVLSTEEEYRGISSYTAQTVELLKNYTQHNAGITVQYIDMLSNPDFIANYPNQSLVTGDIIVEPDDGTHERVKVVSLTDLLNIPDDYMANLSLYTASYGEEYTHRMFVAGEQARQITLASNAEQAITSAIMTVTDANPISIAVLRLDGAKEADISGLTDLLDINGYLISYLNIQTDEISDDIDLVIIPAPKLDYSTDEITKIENWLQGGGMLGKDLIYVASIEQPDTPNLDGLLYKYGMTVEKKVIYETDPHRYAGIDGAGNPLRTYTLQDISTDKYQEDVTNLNRSFLVPDARPITTRFADIDATQACEIIVTSGASSELRDLYGTDLDAESSERGSFNSVVIGRQKKINQDTHISTYTHIIVFGSELMLDSRIVRDARYLNGDFAISMINEITGKTDGITIKPKSVASTTFDITAAQTRTLTLTFALVIPVAVLALGTFVWIRRRHK